MKVVDVRCLNPACGFIYEDWLDRHNDAPQPCPNCDSTKYEIIYTQAPRGRVTQDAYERFLHRRPPDDPISVSVPKNFKGRKKKAAT